MKNNAPKSGFFSTRILLACTLCSLAALLGVVSLPAPGGQRGAALASSYAAPTQVGATSTSMPCPGPAICGQTCSLDPFGTPIYCSNGQCQCASGYDLQNGVCQPIQPEVIGTENVRLFGGYDCPGICPAAQTTTWATVGSIYKAFDLVPVHGIAPGGEAFMPVWGYQATQCGNHGRQVLACQGGNNNGATCSTAADCPGGTCNLIQTWNGCAPDPFPFCYGLQEADEGDFDFNNCDSSEGCGDNCGDVICVKSGVNGCEQFDLRCKHMKPPDSAPPGTTDACNYCNRCVSDFTDAWPYIDHTITCSIGSDLGIDANTSDPSRIDFPNNVIVYRAPTRFEEFSDFWDNPIDDDYTWDMESPGHELFDTDKEFDYHAGCSDETHGRIHVEFSSDQSIDHFTDDDWGAANAWWRGLRQAADSSDSPNPPRCYVKSSVNPGVPCPSGDPDADCSLHDPMAVVVGVPSLDCADDPYHGTDEIHPVLAMAIRIQERCPNSATDCDNPQPEKWAFFYRQHGDTGPCGSANYSRCLSNFKLPLGLPPVSGNGVLTGADVHVDWHSWADKFIGDPSSDISVSSSFDLTDGTVLNIHLPHNEDGVVGLVTVTPQVDTTPPTISCPANITTPVDLGKCTAAVAFAPTSSDNCAVNSVVCSTPSGSAFPIGTTTDTCTATDQAGLATSCTFQVTVTAGNRCPHDQGYWKNHPNLWPVNSLTLGTVTYNKTQLLRILNNSTMGDASVILAKAEIATLLSLANGSNPTPICNTIADADAALDGCTVPCKVGPKTVMGQRMVGDANTLNSYNSGNLTTGCTP